MIRWQCDFNIPDSTVQLAVAIVKIDSFKHQGSNTVIKVIISDEAGEIVAKDYDQILEGIYQDVDAIYDAIKPEFTPSQLV